MAKKNKKLKTENHKDKIDVIEPGDNTEELTSAEEQEYLFELIMDTGHRLEDLSMALCHYDDELAKQALAIAMGNLLAHNGECPCKHDLMEIVDTQIEAVKKHMEEHHGTEYNDPDDDDNNSGGDGGFGNN